MTSSTISSTTRTLPAGRVEPRRFRPRLSFGYHQDLVALVKDINAKRLAAYTDIAAKNGTSVAAVGAVTAEKLYREAPPGTYLMVDGSWVRK